MQEYKHGHIKVALITDPIESLNHYKDTSIAMWELMVERDWRVDYINCNNLFTEASKPCAYAQQMYQNGNNYHLGEEQQICLNDYNLILMRQDPPFNDRYIFNVMLLRLAEEQGAVVANSCDQLLTNNEKLFAMHFPNLVPETLVSRDLRQLDDWYRQHKDVIIKPLDGMGGQGIFHIKLNDDNASSIIETVTQYGNKLVMMQRFIPEVINGDKRIFLIDGEPFPYALARIPKENEARANLAAGGSGICQPLSKHDLKIAETVGNRITGSGLYFVGLDVIGDYLTEINVTSPTGVKELIRDTGLNPLNLLFDRLEEKI